MGKSINEDLVLIKDLPNCRIAVMAASITVDEQGFEDLFACSVCFENFNNEGRKPKFLSCHHTFCLECVKAITTKFMVVTCPICRKDTRLKKNDKFELPNNHYILEMMAGCKSPSKPAAQLIFRQPVKEYWCTKCKKCSSNFCSLLSAHSIISICEYNCSESHFHELQKITDNNESQLRNIIETRMGAVHGEIKSNETSVVQRPLSNQNSKPKPKGFHCWILDSISVLSNQCKSIQTAAASYNSTKIPPSLPPLGTPSRESRQGNSENSILNHNSTSAQLLKPTTPSRYLDNVHQKQYKPLHPPQNPSRNSPLPSPILIAQCYRQKKFKF